MSFRIEKDTMGEVKVPSWGSVGRKYELTAGNYPGIEVLLAAAHHHR